MLILSNIWGCLETYFIIDALSADKKVSTLSVYTLIEQHKTFSSFTKSSVVMCVGMDT